MSSRASIRVALEGCGHGCLNDIYASVAKEASLKGWDGVDLLIIGGDFQAVRNSNDMACMSVPKKYKDLGDFHEYYSGKRTAPYLTIFIGGNHEASNHLFELYYGGWVAPNIYYMGASNVLRCGPLRIAAMSGIWKGYDYRKPHFERIPYNWDEIHSIYHVRELDVRKLLQIRTQVDLGLSHDWPHKIEYAGDHVQLFHEKPLFLEDSQSGRLGSQAARHVLDRLRPAHWFSAHLHIKFTACVQHSPQEAQASGHHHGLDGASITTIILGDEEEETDQSGRPASAAPMYDAPAQTQTESHAVQTEVPAHEEGTQSFTGTAPKPGESENLPTHSASENTTEAKLSAWQNFHQVAAKNEAAENSRFLSEQGKHLDTSINVSHDLTWKKVSADEDGLGRRLTGIERSGDAPSREIKKQKTEHGPQPVKNSDEIDLDLDSDSDAVQMTETSPTKGPSDKPAAEESSAAPQVPESATQADVPEDLRNQLPASFARPQAQSRPQPQFGRAGVVNWPIPEAITNTTTNFLALDKCMPKRNFLELVEFSSISGTDGPEGDDSHLQRPYRLHYDKEWLAITRVFASDLHLGDPSAKPSPDKGHTFYKPLIIEEEKWVEEHVVKPGKLAVPENFTPTAPFYDPDVPITTDQQPQEYNNPQTAAFCELVGIENKFYLTDEEHQARMAAGPRPDGPRGGGRFSGPGRGRGRAGFGGRGGGRGRGRRPYGHGLGGHR